MNPVRAALGFGLLLASGGAPLRAQDGEPGTLRDVARPGVFSASFVQQGPMRFVPRG